MAPLLFLRALARALARPPVSSGREGRVSGRGLDSTDFKPEDCLCLSCSAKDKEVGGLGVLLVLLLLSSKEESIGGGGGGVGPLLTGGGGGGGGAFEELSIDVFEESFIGGGTFESPRFSTIVSMT